MNKHVLIDLLFSEYERGYVDVALPATYLADTADRGVPDQRNWTVWSYVNAPMFGEPVNLAELFVERFSKEIEDGIKHSIRSIPADIGGKNV